ncbi:SDR family NAD(P)-dependent oxidoreductase [[Kitasatospora] papulosa]|uniref:SDR family NAD(P)-dependent oxidoreductase n=1 Tax=[Kitasatospora] papulosa TaxID=1464011 RepID=UPI0036BFFBFF
MSARALEDKVALVTGDSRGIGQAIAERLAQDGAALGVTYARDETAASETVENVRKGGGRVFAIQAGLGERSDAARLWAAFDAAGTEHVSDGKLDIIVNSDGSPCLAFNSGSDSRSRHCRTRKASRRGTLDAN